MLDEEQLVNFVLARKHGSTIDELTENAADSPYVDLFGVLAAHQKFWRPIPPSCHVVSKLLVLFTQQPREPEIAYFEDVLIAYQQVFWLNVPVNHVE